MKITVLGAGGWGTTLSILLHQNGHEVILWEYDKAYAKQISGTKINSIYLPGITIPNEILITHSLVECSTGRDMLVIAIPSQFIRSVLHHLKKINLKNTVIVSVAKGIEKDTLHTVSQIIRHELKDLSPEQIGALSGPSHAEEVSRKVPTAVVSASRDPITAKQIQMTFLTPYFRIYTSTDILGVEYGGALKNVIAIAAGIIDGAKIGDNTKAAIMTRGITEISRLGFALGARADTFSGLSGMGDLIVTCMSKHSRNRYVGEQVGSGIKLKTVLKNMQMVAEGVETCRSVHQLGKKHKLETPISSTVYNILFEDQDPVKSISFLMAHDMRAEEE
jgi:glycerol-3-phosphate dehydrogenase (NAD(P)+)